MRCRYASRSITFVASDRESFSAAVRRGASDRRDENGTTQTGHINMANQANGEYSPKNCGASLIEHHSENLPG